MLSQASVILSGGGCIPSWSDSPLGRHPSSGRHLPLPRRPLQWKVCILVVLWFYLVKNTLKMPVVGDRVISVLDCYAGGHLIESGILLLLKHACGEKWLTTILAIKRTTDVTSEVNLSEHTSHTPLPVGIRLPAMALKTRAEKSKTGVSVIPIN